MLAGVNTTLLGASATVVLNRSTYPVKDGLLDATAAVATLAKEADVGTLANLSKLNAGGPPDSKPKNASALAFGTDP